MHRHLIALTTLMLAITTWSTSLAEESDQRQPEMAAAEKILGFWTIVEGVNQGTEIPDDQLDGMVVLVKRYMMITYDREKNERYRASFKIDESKSPMEIDMTSLVKGQPPAQSLGIMAIEKDQWKICYALPGKPRPTTFTSNPNDRTMMFVHARQEKNESKE